MRNSRRLPLDKRRRRWDDGATVASWVVAGELATPCYSTQEASFGYLPGPFLLAGVEGRRRPAPGGCTPRPARARGRTETPPRPGACAAGAIQEADGWARRSGRPAGR